MLKQIDIALGSLFEPYFFFRDAGTFGKPLVVFKPDGLSGMKPIFCQDFSSRAAGYVEDFTEKHEPVIVDPTGRNWCQVLPKDLFSEHHGRPRDAVAAYQIVKAIPR